MPVHKRDRRIAMAASAGVFQRAVQMASTLVLMPLLLHVLGVAQFGVWGAASSLAWFSGLADIGIGTALVTLVARSAATRDNEAARTHIAGALSFGSIIATLILMIAAGSWVLAGRQAGAGPYLIAIAGLALNIPLNSANNVWMGLQKGFVSGFWELVQTLLTLAGLLAAAAITRDVRFYVAIVYGAIVVANAGSLIHLFVVHPELRPRRLVPWAAVRQVIREGFLLFLLNLSGGLSFLLDNILALHLLEPEALARMTIALRICMSGLGVLVVMAQPLWPAFTEAAESFDPHWIRSRLLHGMAVLVGIAAGSSSVLLVFGERLLRLWLHSRLSFDGTLLWAIAGWIVTQAVVRVPNLLLNALSIIRYQIVVTATTTILALGLKFVLAPYLGVAGMLWATSATILVVALPAVLWRIGRWYSTPGGRKLPEQVVEAELPPVI
jgi:O-antigen/teichoic acid export membrane protein